MKAILGEIIPCGIQILAGLNKQAIATALEADLQFICAEGFVFGRVAEEELMEACAGPLLRYRKQIGADHISIFSDIKKKHSSHPIKSDVDIVETAKAAQFFMVDGVIVMGTSTGQPADPEAVALVASVGDLPVLVGSGVTPENVLDF